MNILLTGFMGAGKTTVGKKLSKRLGYFFIDTDREIEKEQGCTISEIFKYGGEICFRDLETNMLQQLQSKQNLVIATGGGMVMRQENRNLMQNLGTRVYLKVGLEELIRRLKKDKKRPLLQEARPIERITEMLEQRKSIYEEAECIVDTTDLSPQQMVSEIIRKL
ncbi:MAG: shikimate kinase [Deltaproteobacteria bacterium]|jgi:shikimate kinase|nr:shikimate kinase [SAR324 cluster bacterium]MCH2297822.1 shikimate kinase [SAR324 cluster bacterium]MDP6383150.1 shikimate kinase [SAR324 cluster bacterium]MEC7423018.1 shikimate kinase [SAR324 cluster bacterium]MEC7683050.1 shikimate kinase [SAR324 cluster bacterium]|tara:strand:- start:21 stop:515 length:495 start_codon:yes stop_codon:yes gene_type:complete